MISQEKWIILTPLQKLPSNVGDLGETIVSTGCPKYKKSPNLVALIVLIPNCIIRKLSHKMFLEGNKSQFPAKIIVVHPIS